MHPSPRGGVSLTREEEDSIDTQRPPAVRPSGIRPRPRTEPPPESERRDTLPTIPDSDSTDWDLPLAERATTPAPPIADTLIDDLLKAPLPAKPRRSR